MRRITLFLIFAVTACVTFFVQWNMWHAFEFADEPLWQTRAAALIRDLAAGSILNQDDYSGHPGMSFLLVGVILHALFSIPSFEILDASVSLMVAVTVGAIALHAYIHYPKHFPWWLAVAGILAFHPLFARTSPTSAVTAPLLVLSFLYISTLYKKNVPLFSFLLLGIPLGISLATRWFSVLLFMTPLLFLLVVRFKHIYLLLSGVVAAIIAWICNPLLWHHPITHLVYSFNRLRLHVTTLEVDDVSLYDFLLYTPFSIAAVAILIWALISKRSNLFFPLPRPFVTDMLIVSIGTSVLLYLAESHSIRYFFPLIFFWDVIGSLLIVNYVRSHVETYSHRTQSLAGITTVIFLVGAQIYLLMQRF